MIPIVLQIPTPAKIQKFVIENHLFYEYKNRRKIITYYGKKNNGLFGWF